MSQATMSLRRDARAEGLDPGWAGSRNAGDEVGSIAQLFLPRARGVYDNDFHCSKAELAAARAVWLPAAEFSQTIHGKCEAHTWKLREI
jgi:hypothetical protein